MSDKVIYSIGTSNRTIEEFIEILKNFQIERAVDVRSFPKSSRFPHFEREAIRESLEKAGVEYFYLGDKLGGFRKGGYEEHMKTQEFLKGIEELEKIAKERLTVFFCAEKLFLNCHRRFISKTLTDRGWQVLHVVEKNKVYEHKKYALEQTRLQFD